MPPERYLGVERDRESLEKARSGWPAHRFVTPEELDAHPGRMDFGQVVALALIEHLPNPVGWLREMAERLREGGEILLTTPHPRYRRIHELGARVGLFSREGAEEHEVLFDGTAMKRLAEASGLEVVLAGRFLAGANQLFLLRLPR